MTNKELIAEWLGLELVECPLDWADHSACDVGSWALDSEYANDMFVIARDSTDDERVLIAVVDDGADDYCRWWTPDTDIALWHGPDGLLEEIRRRSVTGLEDHEAILRPFMAAVCAALEIPLWHWDKDPERDVFRVYSATPKQLSAALVKVITDGKEARSGALPVSRATGLIIEEEE